MPKAIHDRAKHILSKNPNMPESEAWAIATKQIKQAAALEKVAIDLAGARRALRAVKPNIVKPPTLPTGPAYLATPTESAASAVKSTIPKLQKALSHGGASPEDTQQVVDTLLKQIPVARQQIHDSPLVPGYINLPKKGDPGAIVRNAISPGAEPMTPNEHIFNNALVTTHENAERQVLQGGRHNVATAPLGHFSPEVLLREHNMVTTLPPEAERVRGMWQKARDVHGDSVLLSNLGLNYGSSPRVSRHAIKHLSRIAEEEVLKTVANQVRASSTKVAELEVSNFVAHRLAAPQQLTEQVPEQERRDRAQRWGDHHHITLLNSDELRGLKHKGVTAQMIEQAFAQANDKNLQLGDSIKKVNNRGRSYSIVPVAWDEALKARESLGLPPPKYPLHMTVGVTMPPADAQKVAQYAAFYDELEKMGSTAINRFMQRVGLDEGLAAQAAAIRNSVAKQGLSRTVRAPMGIELREQPRTMLTMGSGNRGVMPAVGHVGELPKELRDVLLANIGRKQHKINAEFFGADQVPMAGPGARPHIADALTTPKGSPERQRYYETQSPIPG